MIKNNYIEFSSPLVKEEKKLVHFLIKTELDLKPLEFLINDLEIPTLKNEKLNFIERFIKKGLYLHSKDERIFFPIFNSYSYKNGIISFNFNSLFIEYLSNKEKIFQFNLPQIIFFKYDFSIDFFYQIIKPNMLKTSFEISIPEFKEIIKKDKYKRLYDIKRFLIEPIIEDIASFTNFKISYSIEKKEKENFIIFSFQNKELDEMRNFVNNFLKLYKVHISNTEKFETILFKSLEIYGYNYTKNKLLLAIKNKKKYNLKFDILFEKFLNNELGEFYMLLKSTQCKIQDLDQLRKLVNKEIFPLNLPEISTLDYNTSLAKKIYSIKPKEIETILSENLKLELLYNPENISEIKVYLKYVK